MTGKPIVIYTDHIINKTLCYNFAKGSNSLMCHVNNFKEFDKTIVTYGFLRGTYEILKKVNNFYYMDHGYFRQSQRNFNNKKTSVIDLDGYFRIVHNNYWHDGLGNCKSDRLKKLNLEFENINMKGDYIILSEPSDIMKKLFDEKNWIEKTKIVLKKYTDRKLIIHNKFSKIPLDVLLKDAWAFVSFQSTAGLKAMVKGVPAYFTDKTLSNIGKIEDVEKHTIDYNIFNNLAYGQWNLDEIKSGEAWEYLSETNKNKI